MYTQTAVSPQRTNVFNASTIPEPSPAIPCLGATAPGSRIARLVNGMPNLHRRLKQGEFLFRAGAAFRAFYVLNAGFIKTCYVSEDGRERTTGFHLRGDVLGLEALASGNYSCDAVALDVCDVLAIPYDAVIEQGQHDPELVREFHRAFGAEIRSDRDQMLTMSSLPAEGRVAAFLLEMSERFGSRGFSATRLQLRLTRHEIGSLIGLKLETVSRALSHFAHRGLITVHLREIVLLDRDELRNIIARSSGLDS